MNWIFGTPPVGQFIKRSCVSCHRWIEPNLQLCSLIYFVARNNENVGSIEWIGENCWEDGIVGEQRTTGSRKENGWIGHAEPSCSTAAPILCNTDITRVKFSRRFCRRFEDYQGCLPTAEESDSPPDSSRFTAVGISLEYVNREVEPTTILTRRRCSWFRTVVNIPEELQRWYRRVPFSRNVTESEDKNQVILVISSNVWKYSIWDSSRNVLQVFPKSIEADDSDVLSQPKDGSTYRYCNVQAQIDTRTASIHIQNLSYGGSCDSEVRNLGISERCPSRPFVWKRGI